MDAFIGQKRWFLKNNGVFGFYYAMVLYGYFMFDLVLVTISYIGLFICLDDGVFAVKLKEALTSVKVLLIFCYFYTVPPVRGGTLAIWKSAYRSSTGLTDPSESF